MIIVGRPINGISLNGDEYLLDDNNEIMEFENEDLARQFLINRNVPTSDLDQFNFKKVEKSIRVLYAVCDEVFDNVNLAAQHIQDCVDKKIILWQLIEDLETLACQLHENQDEICAEVHGVDVRITRFI